MVASPVRSAAAAGARRLRFVLLLAAILVAAATAIVLLSRHADEAQDGRVAAAALDAELHLLEGLEWRVAAGGMGPAAAAELAASRAHALASLARLRGVTGGSADELRALFDAYDAALAEDVRRAQARQAAQGTGPEAADPSFERLDERVEALAASLSASARTTRAWTYAAIGLVLAAALAALLVAQRRRVTELAVARGRQEGLERSAARLRALVEHGNDVIVLCGTDGRIRYSSVELVPPGASRRPGRRPPSGLAFVAAEDRPLARATCARVLRERGSTAQLELRARGAGGERWLEVVATNLLDDPDVAAIVLNIRDVSERRAADERLRRQDEELQQARRLESIGRLAGGVAHDFNNLLAVIIGNAELIDEGLGDSPLREDVRDVITAANRAAGLTRQLLAFSRRQLLQPVELDLNEALRDVHRMLERLIGEEYSLELRLAPEPTRVLADPGQVEQVVLNLCVNARDAMPSGGRLLLETDVVELAAGEAHPGRYARLRVCDTGVGMDEATLARAFEPFFTTKPLGEGTGLGLSTVLGIVEQSDGHVVATSEPGVGTTVSILLPELVASGARARAAAALPDALV